MRYFRRKIQDDMVNWKKCDGKSALLIEGARRIGKTTVVKRFAEENYDSYIVIDFSLPENSDVEEQMSHHGSNFDRFFSYLMTKFKTKLYDRRSLIVFDEVQRFPLARQMIKQLVSDGRYDYIETGSLISIRQNIKDIVIPSEERRVEMHPMDFEEFLWANGDDFSMDAVRRSFHSREPLSDWMHKDLMNLFAFYMITGGMPQAVEVFVDTHSIAQAEEKKQEILQLYREDLDKVPGNLGAKAKDIMDKVPQMLSGVERTFSPSVVEKDSRTRDYFESIVWLGESKMVNLCYRVTDPDPAPGLYKDELSFKIYMADTGLLFTAAFEANVAKSEICTKFLSGRMSSNNGMFFENVVAQEMVSAGRRPIFTKFEFKDPTNPQEVDFLLVDGDIITPVEVKPSYSKAHRSLDRFREKFSASGRIGTGYVIHTKNLEVDGDTVYIPAYMTSVLAERKTGPEADVGYQDKRSGTPDRSPADLRRAHRGRKEDGGDGSD